MNEQWQELKETIIEMRDNNGTGTQQEACKFLANLMDVLEKQMSGSEIPNSSDCISRQAYIERYRKWAYSEYGRKLDNEVLAIRVAMSLPPVNPQPKMGRWISDAIQGQIDSQIVKGFICSECGAISVFRMTGGKIVNGDLCPNCGCRMIELQESEVQDADSD